MLIVGYALVYYPWAGSFVVPSELNGFPAWGKALYYSGYTATTLGVGDIFPRGLALRLVSVLEAAHGFTIITLAITYLLSVYSALNRTTALALEISRFVGRADGKDPVDLLIGMVHSGSEQEVLQWMGRALSSVTSIVQSEGQYPLLHYFHAPDDDRAFPVAVADLLEIAALFRSLLSPAQFPSLSQRMTGAAIERIAGQHFSEGARTFGGEPESDKEIERNRRMSYLSARKRLEASGVPLREDSQAWPVYLQYHVGWDYANRSVRAHFGYPEPS